MKNWKPEKRDAIRATKKFDRAEERLDSETLQKRADNNFKILTVDEAKERNIQPLNEYNKFLVLEKGKIFGWFFTLDGAKKSIEAKVIKNTIPRTRKAPKKKILGNFNTAKG